MPLPNFLIVGAAKAGTTSLHHYLGQHPEVFMSEVKEPNFFVAPEITRAFAVKTLDEYRALFDAATTQRAIGEASPAYLRHPAAADRIKALLPDVKILISLRDPIGRLYSMYLHNLRNGRAGRDVYEWFGTLPAARYTYAAGIERFLDRFPRERIRILLFEELSESPQATVGHIFGFLEVNPDFTPDLRQKLNRGVAPVSVGLTSAIDRLSQWRRAAARWVPRLSRGTGVLTRLRHANFVEPPPPPADFRERMLPHVSSDIERTSRLIGRDLSQWLDASPRAPARRSS